MRFFVVNCLFFSIILSFNVQGQNNDRIEINWLPSKVIKTNKETLTVPTIENQEWDNGKPTFYYTKK